MHERTVTDAKNQEASFFPTRESNDRLTTSGQKVGFAERRQTDFEELNLMMETPLVRIEEEDWARMTASSGEKRRYPRFFFDAPIEYSTSNGSRPRGGYAGNMSERGLLLYSIDHLNIGTELEMAVFYRDEYRFSDFHVLAKIVWKDYYMSEDWKGFQYGLKFSHISEEDREKVRQLLVGSRRYSPYI